MGLIEQAKSDIKDITSNPDEFGVSITLTAPTGEIATLNGLHSKHHMSVNTDGIMINSKNAHISVSEDLLIAQNYPVRKDGEVKLNDHKVSVKDSTGISKNYVIREGFPDETIGLITCILGSFGTN
ncbi:hypothetical protein LCGC14_0579430 [marine sediment metagenome]|uniref:Uncharacterized protein n=1 Tax=marine sediment metagenome TaxID=412755 RepID=A0A0F9UQ36_9ZZZZ